ncbi:hypothetical protein ACJMK2_015837 [Sinanodonta woodiana]
MDEPDPSTGLTPRQKDALRSTWKVASVNPVPTGVTFFIRLFKTLPAAMSYFKTFDGMPLSEVEKSGKLRAHASNFMHGVTGMIDSLDDAECLVSIIQKLTINHHRRNIKPETFQAVFGVLLTFLEDTLESKMDQFSKNAWEAVTSVILRIVTKEVEDLEISENDCK